MTLALSLHDVFALHGSGAGGTAALQGLSLDVVAGEVVVVLGPSGSGKTTLLRLLAAYDRPAAGSAVVLGVDVGRLGERQAAAFRARSVGYLDQHYARALPPELTLREIVGLPLALAGVGESERRARAHHLLERVGLWTRASARPGELSGGEQQRVALCAALVRRPRLLLADEPTGELDATTAREIYRLVEELVREEGCTAVVVSHDPTSAAIADRVVHVRDGRVSDEVASGEKGAAAIVVARGGWLRLPEELLRRAGIRDRARARMEGRGVLLAGDGVGPEPALRPEPVRRPGISGLAAELRAVTKGFGTGRARREVLGGLELGFPEGCLTALTGPSGSGKTTVLRLLAGLELPDAGEVIVGGELVSGLDRSRRAELRRRIVAVVEQGTLLVPSLSARENVVLALAIRGIREPGAADRALASVGLEELAGQRVERLSAGESQRVTLARALAARPRVLLADEPTARLDEANARAMGLLLAAATERGTTVVCATHDPAVIEQAGHEVALSSPDPAATIAAGRAPVPR